MARTQTKSFEGHRVTVAAGRDTVRIEATWVDPVEGDINAHESITLTRDELAWALGVLES